MVTIAEIAKHAGVSPTTVSHVLSGNRPVAPETRERITHIIADLGFRPNALASSLRKRRSHTVALIIPDITNSAHSMVTRGLQDALVAQSYFPNLCNTDAQREQERTLMADVIQRQVDGIILLSCQGETTDLGAVLDARVPLVVVGDSPFHHPLIDGVMTDDHQGAQDATAYLACSTRSTGARASCPKLWWR